MVLPTRAHVGERYSEGSRLLAIHAAKAGSQGKLARLIGTSTPQIARLLWGDRLPSVPLAVRIDKAIGIPPEAWTLPAQEAPNEAAE